MENEIIIDNNNNCNICNKSFKTYVNYKQHMTIHTNPLICPYCDKKFDSSRTFNFKSHVNSHTKEYNFKCSICDKRFITNGPLTQHILKTHPETIKKISKYSSYSSLPEYYKQFTHMTPIDMLLKAAETLN
jgi:hypothetical protein